LAGQRWAMIIGINKCGYDLDMPSLRYAENDARDIYGVLVDRMIGTFQRADVNLLLGDQVLWKEIKARLRDYALHSQPSDVLLVYFAGHALIPAWSRQSDAYLATADLDTDALKFEPDNGLRMAFLKRDIFEMFAGTSFLILDCCNAGAYIESDLRHAEAIGTYGPQIDRHSALLSCPNGASARETEEYGHGVLTHYVLRALRGEAADSDGRVSFAQMANFVAEQPIQPMPGQLVQMWGATTILTQPLSTGDNLRQPPAPSVSIAKVVTCENPLDRCASTIGQLLGRIFRSQEHSPRQGDLVQRAELLRNALQAEAVAIVEFSASGAKVINSTSRFNSHRLQPLLNQSAVHIFPVRKTTLGHVSSDEGGRPTLCVPLTHESVRSLFLAVVDPALSLLEMGEPLAALIQATWNVDFVGDPLQAEVEVVTVLRSRFGRVPASLYEHCFTLYQKLIGSLVMVFQPVISLDKRPHGVGIHSYEALARREETDARAPLNALQLAHVWGDRFIIERDALLLTKALSSYAEADAAGPWDVTKPVSVNVAVRSLLSDTYLSIVRSLLAETRLDPRAVALEISEQDPIQPAPDENWPQPPLKYFHNRLTRLARDLEIAFAVDDFGVGYSSLARMAELPITQIKVDRAVLHHSLALDELELVVRVARYASDLGHASAPRAVIVEGFDDESPVTLRQIYDMRIRHVQGYIAGETATTSLRPLDTAVRDKVAAAVRGEDGQRQVAAADAGR
jgi:EAL domain-containing protein (putative c-di-GMP-specific phosphodiesterase class I)